MSPTAEECKGSYGGYQASDLALEPRFLRPYAAHGAWHGMLAWPPGPHHGKDCSMALIPGFTNVSFITSLPHSAKS
jgi:hypothetical protein